MIELHSFHQRLFVLPPHHGLVMAMTLDDGAAVGLWRLVIRKLLFEELREGKSVFGNSFCSDRFGKQVAHLVAKYRTATWLQDDHRSVGTHIRSKRGQVAVQIRLGHIEKTVVIKWPAAAQMLIQEFDFATSVFQNFDCRLRGFWHEVVVKCISPKKYLGPRTRTGLATAEPRPERLSREGRNLSLVRNTHQHFG